MDRTSVQSSAFVSVGYDTAARVLEVEFTSGGVYRYLDVPAEVHDAFVDAPSLRQYFRVSILDRYRYERVA